MVNENIVLDFYLEQLDTDQIAYLKGRENYKGSIKKSVLELRSCENMHDKIQIAKVLWKTLFEASLTYIDPDKSGYDDLFKFFDEYVEFEELIFASDAFYRDHTIHSLWVYFLGEYLYKKPQFRFIVKDIFKSIKWITGMRKSIQEVNRPDILSDIDHLTKEYTKIISYGESIRCLAALTHDLGYPLKKVRKINSSISKVLPYFSIDNYNEFDFNFNNTQMMFVKDFLERMCMDLSFNAFGNDEKSQEIIRNLFVNNDTSEINVDYFNSLSERDLKIVKKIFEITWTMSRDVGRYLRYSNDFENHEHGILSAFLLTKTLRFFRNLQLIYSASEVNPDNINLSKFYPASTILGAIADHTSKGYQIQSISSVSSLLILVDELEEFSRISRANKNREFINEFCKTDIYVEDDFFNVDFVFDNENIESLDPELAFKGRCKKLLGLFMISDLDEDFRLRLRCIGKLSRNSNTYCLEIKRKYANITINGEEVEIPTYLKSKEFYTKEEYMRL